VKNINEIILYFNSFFACHPAIPCKIEIDFFNGSYGHFFKLLKIWQDGRMAGKKLKTLLFFYFIFSNKA
jgi:hypothetical protein